MSLLLQALQKAQAEKLQSSLVPESSGFSNYQAQQGIVPQGGNTIINTASPNNQGSWPIFIIVLNLMLFIAIGFVWLDWRQNQGTGSRSNTDTLLIKALARELTTDDALNSQPLKPVESSLAEALVNKTAQVREQLGVSKSNQARQVVQQPIPRTVRLDSVSEPAPLNVPKKQQSRKHVKKSNTVLSSLDKKKIHKYDDLPAELLTSFPKLHYNAHLFSPDLPSARMFMANDKRYQEKDRVDANTRVEEIVPEGVVFNFKGLRVKVDVVDELQ